MAHIFEYVAPLPCYAHAHSPRRDLPVRLAVASISLTQQNVLELIQFDMQTANFSRLDAIPLIFPLSQVQFLPSYNASNPELVLAASDSLRFYQIKNNRFYPRGIIFPQDNCLHPLTAADWCPHRLNLVAATNSGGVLLFDIEKETMLSRVALQSSYSCGFQQENLLCLGSDGGVYQWDTRLPKAAALLEKRGAYVIYVQTIRGDANKIAFIYENSQKIYLLDKRSPDKLLKIVAHSQQVECISSAPCVSNLILSCSTDGQLKIFDDFFYSQKEAVMVQLERAANSCLWSSRDQKNLSVVCGEKLYFVSLY